VDLSRLITAVRRQYVIRHVSGGYWTGAKWHHDRKRAFRYETLGELPREIPGYGREAKTPLLYVRHKGGSTIVGYHPWKGDVHVGKSRKSRRPLQAFVTLSD
jgi:hypothetical protein